MNKLQKARIKAAQRRWAREDAERTYKIPKRGDMRGDVVDIVFIFFALMLAAGLAANF